MHGFAALAPTTLGAALLEEGQRVHSGCSNCAHSPTSCPHAELNSPALPQLLEEGQRVHVAFTGEFGPHTTSPRHLTSEVRSLLGLPAVQPPVRAQRLCGPAGGSRMDAPSLALLQSAWCSYRIPVPHLLSKLVPC